MLEIVDALEVGAEVVIRVSMNVSIVLRWMIKVLALGEVEWVVMMVIEVVLVAFEVLGKTEVIVEA